MLRFIPIRRLIQVFSLLGLLASLYGFRLSEASVAEKKLFAEDGIYATGKVKGAEVVPIWGAWEMYYLIVDWDKGDMMRLGQRLRVTRTFFESKAQATNPADRLVLVSFLHSDADRAIIDGGSVDWTWMKIPSIILGACCALFLLLTFLVKRRA